MLRLPLSLAIIEDLFLLLCSLVICFLLQQNPFAAKWMPAKSLRLSFAVPQGVSTLWLPVRRHHSVKSVTRVQKNRQVVYFLW